MADTDPLGEAQAFEEFWALQADPIFRGEGLPQGDGARVLVIPGLLANDFYLMTMHTWLNRIGYQPITSDILWNVGCPKRLMGSIADKLSGLLSKDDRPIHLVGHSRGGLLAKAIAHQYPETTRSLTIVGSPLAGMLYAGPEGLNAFASFMEQDNTVRQFVFNAGKSLTRLVDPNCDSPTCGCEYYDALFAPVADHIPVTSIYSVSDIVVPAPSSHLAFGTNIQVDGTHSGLMFNREVYPHVAKALAAP